MPPMASQISRCVPVWRFLGEVLCDGEDWEKTTHPGGCGQVLSIWQRAWQCRTEEKGKRSPFVPAGTSTCWLHGIAEPQVLGPWVSRCTPAPHPATQAFCLRNNSPGSPGSQACGLSRGHTTGLQRAIQPPLLRKPIPIINFLLFSCTYPTGSASLENVNTMIMKVGPCN